MPEYAKFLKEIFTNKRKLTEAANVTLNEQCSAIVSTYIPKKLKDPGSFHIPCRLGDVNVEKGLADLGASISVMPYSLYKMLDIGELQPTKMRIQLVDRSTKYPKGIVEDVLVRISNFVFCIDFVVVETGDEDISLILGRPFLRTSKAIIDVFEGTLTLRVGKEEATFKLNKSMKYSNLQDDAEYDDDCAPDEVNGISSAYVVNASVSPIASDSSLSSYDLQDACLGSLFEEEVDNGESIELESPTPLSTGAFKIDNQATAKAPKKRLNGRQRKRRRLELKLGAKIKQQINKLNCFGSKNTPSIPAGCAEFTHPTLGSILVTIPSHFRSKTDGAANYKELLGWAGNP
ncbi:hypothetical protein LINGRAHAP2_LOCUS19702 [Linum grandiflorum]